MSSCHSHRCTLPFATSPHRRHMGNALLCNADFHQTATVCFLCNARCSIRASRLRGKAFDKPRGARSSPLQQLKRRLPARSHLLRASCNIIPTKILHPGALHFNVSSLKRPHRHPLPRSSPKVTPRQLVLLRRQEDKGRLIAARQDQRKATGSSFEKWHRINRKSPSKLASKH